MTTSRHARSRRARVQTLVVPILAASFTAMACQLTTQLQPDSLSTNLLSVRDVDPDQDGVPSARDNCPLSPNPDQAKSEQSDTGTACENLLPSGIALALNRGVVQVQLDSNGRPTRIAAPTLTLSIEWPEKPGTLQLTIDAGDSPQEFALLVDFGDVAVLEAAQAVEAASKEDTANLRAWVSDHPGWVQSIADGRMPSLLSPRSFHPAPPGGTWLVSSRLPQAREDVEFYLSELSVIAAVTMANYHDYVEQHPELDPVSSAIRNQLLDIATAVSQAATQEVARCEPWTLACHYKGKPGSCTLPASGRQVCVEGADLECTALGGRFDQGGSCPGACWAATENLAPQCAPSNQSTCEGLPERSNIPGSGFYVTAVFCADRSCSDPLCKPDMFPGRVP